MWTYKNLLAPESDYPYQLPYRFENRYEGISNSKVFRDEVFEWCKEQFGPPGLDNVKQYRYTFYSDHGSSIVVIFRDQIDACAFRLRWWD